MNTKYSEALYNNNLKILRTRLNLRQVDVADIMGFEVIDRISHWEKGRAQPGLINAIRLAILFDTDLRGLYPELYAQIEFEIHASQNRNYIKSLQA